VRWGWRMSSPAFRAAWTRRSAGTALACPAGRPGALPSPGRVYYGGASSRLPTDQLAYPRSCRSVPQPCLRQKRTFAPSAAMHKYAAWLAFRQAVALAAMQPVMRSALDNRALTRRSDRRIGPGSGRLVPHRTGPSERRDDPTVGRPTSGSAERSTSRNQIAQ
jgi:hypothetical protein